MQSEPPQPNKPRPRLKNIDWVLLGLCVVLFLVAQAYWPMFGKFRDISSLNAIVRSWGENDYDHGYFILPAIVFLIWRNWKDVQAAEHAPSNSGLGWVVLSMIVFVLGVQSKHFRLTVMAIPPLIYGSIVYLWGKQVAKSFVFPLLLVYFAIPVPNLQQATNGLQLMVTKTAVGLGQLCGMQVTRSGNEIEMAGAGGFDVSEGCSGIRSLVALTLVAFVYGYFSHKEWWKRFVIFGSSIPLAMVANGIRIFSILVVALFNPDFAKKEYHDSSGFSTFGAAVLCLKGLSYLLNNGFKLKRAKTVVRRSKQAEVSTH
jgi:exosortase